MWTVPRREGPDERCDRLIALYEQQIADLAASRPTPYWDGGWSIQRRPAFAGSSMRWRVCSVGCSCVVSWWHHVRPRTPLLQAAAAGAFPLLSFGEGQALIICCQPALPGLDDGQLRHGELAPPAPIRAGHCGLVQVRDEDYVRPDSAQNTAAAAAPAEQEAAEHTRQRQQRARQHPAAPGQDTRRAAEGLAAGLCTPPAASPRSSPGSSPFKPGPGALPRGKQSASVLADRVRPALGGVCWGLPPSVVEGRPCAPPLVSLQPAWHTRALCCAGQSGAEQATGSPRPATKLPSACAPAAGCAAAAAGAAA